MRILLLTQFHAPVIGGEERHVTALSEALAERGHAVTVGTFAHPDRAPDVVVNGVRIVSVSGLAQRGGAIFSDAERRHAPPFPDPELALRLAALASDVRPDVVHAHNWIVHSYLPVRRFSNVPLVMSLHDYGLVCARKTLMRDGAVCDGPSLKRCLPCAAVQYGWPVGVVTTLGNMASSRAERRLVDRFIAVSAAVASSCRIIGAGVPYDILPTFIPNGVATLSAGDDPSLSSLPRDGYLLYVGDLNRNKGVAVLLSAYAKLADAPPLVMIGRRCVDMPDELPPGVTVYESWPHASVMHAWSRCLFGIAPSVWPEACGTIVMEANAVGRPMVASRIGGLADLVVPGVTGLFAEPGNPADLASAMRRLIDDRSLCAALSAGALAHAPTFMAKTVVPRIEAIYAEAIAERHRQGADTPLTRMAT